MMAIPKEYFAIKIICEGLFNRPIHSILQLIRAVEKGDKELILSGTITRDLLILP